MLPFGEKLKRSSSSLSSAPRDRNDTVPEVGESSRTYTRPSAVAAPPSSAASRICRREEPAPEVSKYSATSALRSAGSCPNSR